MADRIDELTPEMEAAIPGHVEKWTQVALCTDPIDLPLFTEGARECYGHADIEWPGDDKVIVVPSPLIGATAFPIALAVIDYLENEGHVDTELLVTKLTDAAVGKDIPERVSDVLDSRLFHKFVLDGRAHRPVTEAVASIMEDMDEIKRDCWWRYLAGQFWAGWHAYTSFYRDVCDLELKDNLWDIDRSYAKCALSACWWWPARDFVMVSDRPKAIHVDDEGRLHSGSGRSIEWRDGWGVYAWHGVRVPGKVIMDPNNLTADEINKEQNVEVRRIMVERLGAERYMSMMPHDIVDDGRDGWGKIIRVTRGPEDSPLVLNELVDPSTGRVYHLRVPPHITRGVEAEAWRASNMDDASRVDPVILAELEESGYEQAT